MIKGLAITPPILGRISIGKVVEKNGKRLPEKDDQFTITSQIQGKEGWVKHPLDEQLRANQQLNQQSNQNQKLRSIPVRMVFNDPELNLRAEYSLFDRQTGRPICVGNGEICQRLTQQGVEQLPCPSPDLCPLAQGGQCKPYGRLHVICGHETRIFKVTRSESVIQHIINAERHFWECIENDTPPDADASESAAKALQLLYPEHVPLSTTDLSEDTQANQQFEQLIQARHQIEKHQEQFDLLKHQLQAKMQQAERATFSKGSVTWKKSKDSISLDSKALLKQHPEYLSQFPQNKQGSRRFNIYTD